MTVTKLAVIDTYIGLSTDEKPTTGVRAGSRWLERDTGREYAYDGDGWSTGFPLEFPITFSRSARRQQL